MPPEWNARYRSYNIIIPTATCFECFVIHIALQYVVPGTLNEKRAAPSREFRSSIRVTREPLRIPSMLRSIQGSPDTNDSGWSVCSNVMLAR